MSRIILHLNKKDTFVDAYMKIKMHFDTDDVHQDYYTDWHTMTFTGLQQKLPDKDRSWILQILFHKLRLCYRALRYTGRGDPPLRDDLLRGVRGVPEFKLQRESITTTTACSNT